MALKCALPIGEAGTKVVEVGQSRIAGKDQRFEEYRLMADIIEAVVYAPKHCGHSGLAVYLSVGYSALGDVVPHPLGPFE